MAEQPDDRTLTAYEAVRAHELMLNEAVSRFEHARLAPLVTLNGGAVVAFLTLLGALLGKESGRRPDLWLSGLAAGAWVVGLVAGALAIASAASRQTAISAAYRLLREALEDALINEPGVAEILQGPTPGVEPPPPGALRHPFQRARGVGRSIKQWWRGPPGDGAVPDRVANAEATPDTGPAPKRSDGWNRDRDHRQEKRAKARSELRATATAHALRFKARWWLSVAMFVTGAALALAAILSGDPVSKPARTSVKAARTAPPARDSTAEQSGTRWRAGSRTPAAIARPTLWTAPRRS